MRVLDGDDEPIPGLLAAGVDVGGVAVEGYFGGLSRGLVFGIRAAREAARQRERRPAAS
jgi:predicted oxidoreductase